jgi:NAD(P)-dependent dehydrogenase (short-subunit alcohol dehydrogenase family)
MSNLSRKTALISGASRRMGRAAALELAKASAQVHYSSGAKEAEAVLAEIREMGARADAVQADLAAPDGAHRLAKQVRDIVGTSWWPMPAYRNPSPSKTPRSRISTGYSASMSARRLSWCAGDHRHGGRHRASAQAAWRCCGTTRQMRFVND